MRSIAEELVEVVPRRVVEGEARCPAQLGVKVLKTLTAKLRLSLEDLFLLVGENAIEAPEDGERKDDVLVVTAPERVADQIRHTPEEADDFAVIHRA